LPYNEKSNAYGIATMIHDWQSKYATVCTCCLVIVRVHVVLDRVCAVTDPAYIARASKSLPLSPPMEDNADEIMRLAALCGRWRSEAPQDGGRWSELPARTSSTRSCATSRPSTAASTWPPSAATGTPPCTKAYPTLCPSCVWRSQTVRSSPSSPAPRY
jgi:hypothetical protein